MTAVCVAFSFSYGWEFVNQAYVYHLTRKDIHHNFSMYFYMLYLTQGSWLSSLAGMVTFLPQFLLVQAAAVVLHQDPPFCCFIQTLIFVTFNKVCTSQVSCLPVSLLASIHYKAGTPRSSLCSETFTYLSSQYFLWYLCFLPISLNQTCLQWAEAVTMATLWFIGQVKQCSKICVGYY